MINFLVNYLPNIILSFIITYISIPPIIRVSNAKQLFDEPNHRKLNKVVVPTLGGVGIFIGMTLSFILFQRDHQSIEFSYLFGAVLMLFFIGLKDDILVISAKKKFLIQLAAAAMLVFAGDFRIENMNGLFGLNAIPELAGSGLAFAIFLFLINAMNLIDGIDGLAAGIGVFVSLIIGFWFGNQGFYLYAILSFSLCGSLLAFLRFNLWGGENKIFMGDTGSLILGAVLSVLVIKFNNIGANADNIMIFSHLPSIILSLLIVPICDVLRVFTIRLLNGKSPFAPDMNHIHHMLIKMGLTHKQASGFLVGYTSFFVILSVVVQDYTSVTVSFFSILVFSFCLIGAINWIKNIQIRHNVTHMKLTRKILTIGLDTDEEKLIEVINRKKLFFFKRRA